MTFAGSVLLRHGGKRSAYCWRHLIWHNLRWCWGPTEVSVFQAAHRQVKRRCLCYCRVVIFGLALEYLVRLREIGFGSLGQLGEQR